MKNPREVFRYVSELSVEDFDACIADAGVDITKLQDAAQKLYSKKSAAENARAEMMAQILGARKPTRREKLLKAFRFKVYEDLKALQQSVIDANRQTLTYAEMQVYIKKVHKMKVADADLQRMMIELDSEKVMDHLDKITAMVEGRTATQLSAKIRNELNLHLPPSVLVELGILSPDAVTPRGGKSTTDGENDEESQEERDEELQEEHEFEEDELNADSNDSDDDDEASMTMMKQLRKVSSANK